MPPSPRHRKRSTPQPKRAFSRRTPRHEPPCQMDLAVSAVRKNQAEENLRQGLSGSLAHAHHKQALTHVNLLLWASMISAFVGLLLVGYVSILAPGQLSTLLKVLSAMVPITLLLFRQVGKAREHSMKLFNKGYEESQQSQAMDVAGLIANKRLRDIVRAQIALLLAGPHPPVSEAATGILEQNHKLISAQDTTTPQTGN